MEIKIPPVDETTGSFIRGETLTPLMEQATQIKTISKLAQVAVYNDTSRINLNELAELFGAIEHLSFELHERLFDIDDGLT